MRLLLAAGGKESSGSGEKDEGEAKRIEGGEDQGAKKEVVQASQEEGKGKGKGLSTFLLSSTTSQKGSGSSSLASIFGPNGLPPFPTGMNSASSKGAKGYVLDTERTEGFPEQ